MLAPTVESGEAYCALPSEEETVVEGPLTPALRAKDDDDGS